MAAKVRIKNDIILFFDLYTGEGQQPEDLSDIVNLSVQLKDDVFGSIIAPLFSATGNRIRIDVTADMQSVCGRYNLIVSYNRPNPDGTPPFNTFTIDQPAFELVPRSIEAGSGTELVPIVQTILLNGVIGVAGPVGPIGPKGDPGFDAYEVWATQPGNEGKTIEEYFAFLQNPAYEAGITAVEAAQISVLAKEHSESAKTAAEQSAAEALAAKQAAETAETNAETAQGLAEHAKTAAEAAQAAATEQAGIANTKAGEASTSAQNAATSEQNALASKNAAKVSEDAAKLSETNAGISATSALQAKNAAETAKGLAEAARDAADLSKTAAETAENNAELAQAAAEQAKTGAESARDTALNTVNDVRETGEKNSADIRTLENTLNSANINQETTATVSGVDTVLLPKTAANTGMQVQLFGQSAGNLAVNGDFRDGTLSPWTVSGAAYVITNGVIEYTANNTNQYLNQSNSLFAGSKYYLRALLKADSDKIRVVLGMNFSPYSTNISLPHNGSNTFKLLSGVFTVTVSGNHVLRLRDDRTSDYTTAYATGFMLINLTATFGAGNEPTKEQCDILFANYFEGSDSVLGTGRVRSIGKNLLNLNPYGKRIYNGQVDGMTEAQRRLYYDIFRGITRAGLISAANAKSFLLNEYELSFESVANGFGVGFKFKAKAGDVFSRRETITGGSGGQSGLGFYDSNGTLLLQSYAATLTAPADTAFGILVLAPNTLNAVATYTNIQLERGNVVTAYEPYKESSLYLTTPELRSNGLIKDEIRKGTNGYELVRRINPADGTVLVTPLTIPIQHAGLLNSNSNGTAYFEPIIADAGVYSSNLAIQLTDYPIASFESIRKYANGTYTELNTATAVIASGGLSFTHPDLASGDLVMFTYAYSKESIGRSMTLTHYDSRFVEADTTNGKVYRWGVTITNGVPTLTAMEV